MKNSVKSKNKLEYFMMCISCMVIFTSISYITFKELSNNTWAITAADYPLEAGKIKFIRTEGNEILMECRTGSNEKIDESQCVNKATSSYNTATSFSQICRRWSSKDGSYYTSTDVLNTSFPNGAILFCVGGSSLTPPASSSTTSSTTTTNTTTTTVTTTTTTNTTTTTTSPAISDNPQTGTSFVMIIWIIGLSSMIYTLWYYLKQANKSNI